MKAFFYVIWMVLKRVLSHWKLELNLLITFIITASVVATIPLFTNGSLQYSFEKALEQYTVEEELSADIFRFSYANEGKPFSVNNYKKATDYMNKNIPDFFKIPVNYSRKTGQLANYFIQNTSTASGVVFGRMVFLSNIAEMIEITEGRMPAETEPSEFLEVMVHENCLNDFELFVGREYPFPYTLEADPENGRPSDIKTNIPLKVVGVFKEKEAYFNSPDFIMTYFDSAIIMEENTWIKMAEMESIYVDSLRWQWSMDFSSFKFHTLSEFYNNLQTLENQVNQMIPGVQLEKSPRKILKEYYIKSGTLKTLLFAISLPVLGIALYYIIMAVNLMISRRRTEIALLQSRGAGRGQVCLTYIIEWGIIGIISVIIAPFIGSGIAQMLGAAKGFLSFVGREPIKTTITGESFLFAGILILITLIATLIPVFIAAGQSIVNYKQETSRKNKKPLWQRMPTEFILIGAALFGYYMIKAQASGGNLSQNVILDPSLFLLPVLMILGFVLLTLRLLPWIINLCDKLFTKNAGITLNMTLKLLSRSPGHYNPLIFLIIITVSIGIYSSSTARTMDKNFIDTTSYEYGADVVLDEKWVATLAESGMVAGAVGETKRFEPPFYIHQNLEGVESAARVLKFEKVFAKNALLKEMNLIAIDPHEFYDTAWFRDDLLDYPIHEYFNLLIQHESGLFLSEAHAKEAGVLPGDYLTLDLDGVEIDFLVMATVKYWPSLFPNKAGFAITHINYVQNFVPITPYSVWLKLNPDANLNNIVRTLEKAGIYVWRAIDTQTKIIEGIRNPQRTGLYGLLSTGFLLSSLVTIAGFLFYTFLSLKNRMLHFGVLRAIGLKVNQLMGMILLELLLTVGLSISIGTLLGEGVSKLFLPLLRMNADITGNVPPFVVVLDIYDKLNIYIILGSALLAGIIGVQAAIRKMKINQAVKLGEDL